MTTDEIPGAFAAVMTQEDSDKAPARDLLTMGDDYSTNIGPFRLRKCTLATIAKLMGISSPFLNADSLMESRNTLRHVAEYIILQDMDRELPEVVALIDNPAGLALESYRVLERISAEEGKELALRVLEEIRKFTRLRAEPVADPTRPATARRKKK